MDVVALNLKKKEIVEVEIKISKSDLLNELKHKSDKHKSYQIKKNETILPWLIPNRYYFCVPTFLVSDAISYAEKINNKYGVIEFKTDEFIKNINKKRQIYKNSSVLSVRKRSGLLHKNLDDRHLTYIAKRCSTMYITQLHKDLQHKIK
jgi:hypothetical protein